jgi:hypothetical protein
LSKAIEHVSVSDILSPATLQPTINKRGIGYCGYSGKLTDEKPQHRGVPVMHLAMRYFSLSFFFFFNLVAMRCYSTVPANDRRDGRFVLPFSVGAGTVGLKLGRKTTT